MLGILFLGANPSDTTRLALAEEIREITEQLRATPRAGTFELRQEWAIRARDLQTALLRHEPHIVHFSGHGRHAGASRAPHPAALGGRDLAFEDESDASPGNGGGILVQDDAGGAVPLGADALGDLFRILRGRVRCVVLNACFSEPQAEAIAPHVDYVVGMTRAIQDASAITFAWSFYRALGFGRSIEEAFELGRNQVVLAGLGDADVPRLLQRAGAPHGSAAGGWEAQLEALLEGAFTAKGLRQWIHYNVPSLKTDASIAAAGEDAARLAAVLAVQLGQRGLAREALFDSLAALTSPQDVEVIRAAWRASTEAPQARPPVVPASTGAAGSAVATFAAPARSGEDASHTSIVLDRIRQWRMILEHCGTRREHLAFIVHGSVEQDLHLFLRRIQSYLHHECGWLHRVVKVQRTSDGTTATTAEEWQRSLLRATQARGGELDFALAKEAAKAPILFLFVDADGPLRDLSKECVRGLVQLFRSRIDVTLSSLADKKGLPNPVRFLLPIEHQRRDAEANTTVQALAEALGGAQVLFLEPVQELGLPDWNEVRAHIQNELGDPGEGLLAECEQLHRAIFGSPDPSLQRLGDALERVLSEWEKDQWYKRR